MGSTPSMLLKYAGSLALSLLSVAEAGDGCSEGRHCVCYDDIGECYSENSPWGQTAARPLRDLPDSPSKINPEFHLFSRQNTNSYKLLVKDQAIPTEFRNDRRTVFLCHGFCSSGEDKGWMNTMKDEILAGYDYNVVMIDWENGANVGVFNLDYPKASQNTRVVGDMFGQLLQYMESTANLQVGNVHCIGHSLGAHVCGYAGKVIKYDRISGMDPAGPYFEDTPDYVRLDKADAAFVDSIHTDGEPLFEAGCGMMQAISHVDYYPNGGVDQPGCRSIKLGCSHARSHELYVETIRGSCELTGHKCDSYDAYENGQCEDCTKTDCGNIGWFADRSQKSGKYYLDTTKDAPYCL